METDENNNWVKKFRILTLALIFSGALNIGLFASILYFVLNDRQNSFSVRMPTSKDKKAEATNGEWILAMSKLSFRELVNFLTHRDLVEEGYSKRDLAIASLVNHHHFNLEKAISGAPLQRRFLQIGEEKKIEVFPGLTDEQFEAIIRYAYQEKWPLTSKGLFLLLQKWAIPRDESLEQAFAMTPEFYALQVLFQKTEAPQEAAILLDLIAEGNWDILERFSSEQAQMLDFSIEKRERLLLSYLAVRSPTAAKLLLKTDFSFALKRLEDRGILDLVSLLTEKTEEAERFCLELLQSPRADSILQAAAFKLYAFAGETPPNPIDLKAAIGRFAPQVKAPVSPQVVALAPLPAPKPAYQFHVVKEGENLWKIARQYKIKVDLLTQANEIEKNRLFPGMTLKIPLQGTGSEPPR